MKEGGFLGVARGNWGIGDQEHLSSTARHQPVHLPQAASTQRSQHSSFFNVTSTSSRSSTVMTLAHSEPAERRAGTAQKPLHHPSRSFAVTVICFEFSFFLDLSSLLDDLHLLCMRIYEVSLGWILKRSLIIFSLPYQRIRKEKIPLVVLTQPAWLREGVT